MARFTVLVKLTTQAGRRAKLVDAFARYIEATTEETGTLAFRVFNDEKDDNVVWVFEDYEGDEAVATHLSSDAFHELSMTIEALSSSPIEINQIAEAAAK